MTGAPTRDRGISKKKKSPMPSRSEAEAFMYDACVLCHIDLSQEWRGWKIRGRDLVDPDGVRISVGRMRALMFREAADQRRDRAHIREKRPTTTNVVRLGLPVEHGDSAA